MAARYSVREHGNLGFVLGQRETDRPLVIDPVYSIFLGGSQLDEGQGIAVDSLGNVYVAGFTYSNPFPTTDADYATPKNSYSGGADAFLAKINPSGNGTLYSTYLGGVGDDQALAIAIDPQDNVYLTGFTESVDFPLQGSGSLAPLQSQLAGEANAFVAKFAGSSGDLLYSTYLGGDGSDSGNAIAAGSGGQVFVAGYTSSSNFKTAAPLQANLAGSQNAFVSKLNTVASTLVYSTYLGGDVFDAAQAIAVDAQGDAYVTGLTFSSDFPNASGSLLGPQNAFVAKLNPSGSALLYSLYLGGSGFDSGQGIAVNGAGDAFVAGYTSSPNFPTNGSLAPYQRMLASGASQNAFVTELSPTASIVYSTYLGGNGTDQANALVVDRFGNAFVAGFTSSTNFPTMPTGQSQLLGGQDAFFSEFNLSGTVSGTATLSLSTYFGGSGSDQANAIAPGPGDLYITGLTTSANFASNPAPQLPYEGNGDAFVTVFAPAASYPAPALGRLAPWLAAILLLAGLCRIRLRSSSTTPVALSPRVNALPSNRIGAAVSNSPRRKG